jgi:regulator of protease activity HflC (stomatin/prohibitin superfamily)
VTGVFIATAAIAVMLLFLLSASIRRAREYERGVVFRLGRLHSPPKGPGLFLLVPIVDKMVRVDLRTSALNVPPQEAATQDKVPVRVDAVADFRVIDPEKAIMHVEYFVDATSHSSQAALRSVIAQNTLERLLSEQDEIGAMVQRIADEEAQAYGVNVSTVRLQNIEVRPPNSHGYGFPAGERAVGDVG